MVRKGDTISSIAERCSVNKSRILDLNYTVKGTKDLRAGMVLKLTASGPESASNEEATKAAKSLISRFKNYVEEGSGKLKDATEAVTQSVQEFIQRNPDLHQRVRKLGEKLNIPGMGKVEAQISLSTRSGPPGTPVTLSAIGLPSNQPVEIAGGAPDSDYRMIESTRTTKEGTLLTTVELPAWAGPQTDFIFVVAIPQINIAVRSAIFDVTKGASTSK